MGLRVPAAPHQPRTLAARGRGCRPTAARPAVQAPQGDRRTAADVDWETAQKGVLIAGAGIAGLATAAALQKVGIPALVLERHAEQRRAGSAIGLWPNAFRALDALGAAEPLREAHPLLQRVELCKPDGGSLKRFGLDECGGGPHEFRGVLRSRLLAALEEQLAPGSVVYGSPIEAVESTPQGAAASLGDGTRPGARAVVGADGGRSRVAAALRLPTPGYAGYSAYRGVAEFDGPLPIALDTVRQILGRGVRAGMYPLSPTSLYWFIAMTCPEEGGPSSSDECKADCEALVAGWGCGIQEAVALTPADAITRNRITDRWLFPGRPFGSGQVTLVGDAFHPMTPNLGQGGCLALEDAVVLAQTLRDAAEGAGAAFGDLPADVVAEALRTYERKRVLRATKITVRSNLMGQILGSSLPPVCLARDLVIRSGLPIRTFMDHTRYDCGRL